MRIGINISATLPLLLASCGGEDQQTKRYAPEIPTRKASEPPKLEAGARFAVGPDGAMCAPGAFAGQTAMADAIRAARSGVRVGLAALVEKGKLVKLDQGVTVEYMTESGGLYYVRVQGRRQIGERCWVLPGQVERR